MNLRHAQKTGRQRYRIQRLGWLGRRYVCVLQVEEEGFVTTCCAGHTDTQFIRRWRDATVGDVSLLHGANYGDPRLHEQRV